MSIESSAREFTLTTVSGSAQDIDNIVEFTVMEHAEQDVTEFSGLIAQDCARDYMERMDLIEATELRADNRGGVW